MGWRGKAAQDEQAAQGSQETIRHVSLLAEFPRQFRDRSSGQT
jgi:hypothetical protein